MSPGTNGSMRVALGDVGITRKTLKVRDEAGEHEIVVEAEVKEFVDGCGCSREPSDTTTAAAMGGLLLAFCRVTAGRRRRLF